MANYNEDDLNRILSNIDGNVYGNSPSGAGELPQSERTHHANAGQRAMRAKRTVRVPSVEDQPGTSREPVAASAPADSVATSASAAPASNSIADPTSADTTAVLGTDGWEHTPDHVEGAGDVTAGGTHFSAVSNVKNADADATAANAAGHDLDDANSVGNASVYDPSLAANPAAADSPSTGAQGFNSAATVNTTYSPRSKTAKKSNSGSKSGDAMRNKFQGAHAAPAAPKPKKSHRGAGKAVAAIVAGLAIVYVGGSVYFMSHFLPNTKVGNYDASGLTVDELAQQITNASDNYQLNVTGDNFTLNVNGSDIDYSSDGTAFAENAKSQFNAWAWPVIIAGEHDYNVTEGVSYDSDKLNTLVSQAVDDFNSTATAPVNATLKYDSGSQQFSIADAQGGTALNKDSVEAVVSDAVSNASSQAVLDDSNLEQPTVTADSQSLKDSLQKANELAGKDLTLTYNGATVATVSSDQFASWFTVDDSGNVSGDLNAITTWAQGDFSKQYDTVGTARTYTRPDGKQFTVTGGEYGWVVDGAGLAQNIVSAIQQNSATAEVPMKSTAVNWVQGGQDWGARYIDCDLTEQHARMYDESGNLIWESNIVSGDPTENNSTPEGVYTINDNKGTNQTLKGLDENHDGQPDYTSQVSYWMPFVDNLVAFHDASWRSSFGGTIYSGNGSHGCVNLPSSAAATLYQLTQVGDVVVVHY